MATKREQMIETTRELLELQGYTATGLNQILQESGAPRGSLYYYFPEGKDELIAEAIDRTGVQVEERIRHHLGCGGPAAEAIPAFIVTLARGLEGSGFRFGSITAVAYEAATKSERINGACQAAYERWTEAFACKLRESDPCPERADRIAAMIVSSLEGAIVLSRTRRSTLPMEQVAREIGLLIRCGGGERT
ncbi:MAG: TetR/AcrR family transcriptional regulator [Bacillota bacterium]